MIKCSFFVKEYVAKRGSTHPSSQNTIAALKISFLNEKKVILTSEFKRMINTQRFSITVDEWIDCSHRRYVNLTSHNEKSYRFSFRKIDGSCDAYKTLEMVKTTFASYG
jgi:hypothetical protein